MRPGGLELLREAGNSAGIATFVAGEDWDSGSRNLREPGKNIFTLFFYPNLSIFYCFVHVYMFITTNRVSLSLIEEHVQVTVHFGSATVGTNAWAPHAEPPSRKIFIK